MTHEVSELNIERLLSTLDTATSRDVHRILETLMEILGDERSHMGYDTFKVEGGLATIVADKPELLIIGDIHGDIHTLVKILEKSKFERRIRKDNFITVFLGDYVDRGPYSVEVFLLISMLKIDHSEKIIVLRGNHEPPPDLMPSPHDLPLMLVRKFSEQGYELHKKFMEAFQYLYHAALVPEAFFMVHGGVPVKDYDIKSIAYADKYHPEKSTLEELLWNDPTDLVNEWTASPRGAGKLFGINVTTRFLKRYGIKAIVRGHEPAENGFKEDHGGRVLTLFSRVGAPYFNRNAAYMDTRVTEKLTRKKLLESVKVVY
ncbi:serine/threonine protein phosphatase [archaeon]|nr:MAG: serine/threonine protein phosphatase [archaeon]